MLFSSQRVTLTGQVWKTARSLHVDVTDDPLAAWLEELGWGSETSVLTGTKVRIGSLSLRVRDGFIRSPIGRKPCDAGTKLNIVSTICWHEGILIACCMHVLIN